jgi:hypothetical protein
MHDMANLYEKTNLDEYLYIELLIRYPYLKLLQCKSVFENFPNIPKIPKKNLATLF